MVIVALSLLYPPPIHARGWSGSYANSEAEKQADVVLRPEDYPKGFVVREIYQDGRHWFDQKASYTWIQESDKKSYKEIYNRMEIFCSASFPFYPLDNATLAEGREAFFQVEQNFKDKYLPMRPPMKVGDTCAMKELPPIMYHYPHKWNEPARKAVGARSFEFGFAVGNILVHGRISGHAGSHGSDIWVDCPSREEILAELPKLAESFRRYDRPSRLRPSGVAASTQAGSAPFDPQLSSLVTQWTNALPSGSDLATTTRNILSSMGLPLPTRDGGPSSAADIPLPIADVAIPLTVALVTVLSSLAMSAANGVSMAGIWGTVTDTTQFISDFLRDFGSSQTGPPTAADLQRMNAERWIKAAEELENYYKPGISDYAGRLQVCEQLAYFEAIRNAPNTGISVAVNYVPRTDPSNSFEGKARSFEQWKIIREKMNKAFRKGDYAEVERLYDSATQAEIQQYGTSPANEFQQNIKANQTYQQNSRYSRSDFTEWQQEKARFKPME